MSNGQHPFGDVVKRQLNILSYEYDLRMFSNPDCLDSTGILAEELIKDMINQDHTQRPPAKAILTHPVFWHSEKILNFLQVSFIKIPTLCRFGTFSNKHNSLEHRMSVIGSRNWIINTIRYEH